MSRGRGIKFQSVFFQCVVGTGDSSYGLCECPAPFAVGYNFGDRPSCDSPRQISRAEICNRLWCTRTNCWRSSLCRLIAMTNECCSIATVSRQHPFALLIIGTGGRWQWRLLLRVHVINRCTPSIHSCTTFTTCRIPTKFGTTRIAVALLRIILCHHSASCDVAALNSFQLKPIGVPVDCHASNQRIQFRENNEERARRLVGVGYRAFSPKANQSVWIFSTRSGDALQVTFPSSVALSHPLPSSHSSLPPRTLVHRHEWDGQFGNL